MEKMEYSKTLDKIIDKSLLYGDLISFTAWKKKTEEYRRPITFFETLKNFSKLPQILAAKAKGGNFFIDERVIYDNPYTYAAAPANFVFDSVQFNDFDSCPKIYKTWKTPDYIKSSKYFEISKEIANDLDNLVKAGSSEADISNQNTQNLRDDVINGITIEMLEHWGDLTLDDGTVLKNWYAAAAQENILYVLRKTLLL